MRYEEYMKKCEEKYIKDLWEKYRDDGLILMSKVAGISFNRLKEKLNKYGFIYSKHHV